VVLALSKNHPILLTIDDLQWADPSSLELLFHITKRIEDSRILLIGTYRPEEVSASRDGSPHPFLRILGDIKRYYGDVIINLDQSEIDQRDFVWELVDAEPNLLDEQFREELLRHTGGNALFTVELLREVKEREFIKKNEKGLWIQIDPILWDELPPRIEGVLETRIGRLNIDEQETLQIAAVEGQTFTGEIISKIQKKDPGEIIRLLNRGMARQHDLIIPGSFQKSFDLDISSFSFRHVLFQKFLYSKLEESERVYLHRAVGEAIEGLFGENSPERSVELAYHYTQSQDVGKAIRYLLISGKKAQNASAYNEAVDTYLQALKLIETVPINPNRRLQELTIYLSLGNIYSVVKGAADPSVKDAFNKAVEYSNDVEDSVQSFVAIRGLSYFHKMRGDFERCAVFERQLLEIAERLQDPMLLTEAHRLIAESHVGSGRFIEGQKHYDLASNYYQEDQHPKFISILGSDSGVIAQSQLAYFTWTLGYPDRAISLSKDILNLSNRLKHPFSQAICLDSVSALYHQLRDPQMCLEVAEDFVNISNEYGFVMWSARAQIRQGWALTMLEQGNQGILLIEQGLNSYKELGVEISLPCMYAIYSEALHAADRVDEALKLTSTAMQIIEKLNERYCEVEILRIRGDCFKIIGDTDESEAAYRSAIEIAKSQMAKSLELRGRLHLVKLLIGYGSPEEEIKLLKLNFQEFEEGFDTSDLLDVKHLLEQYQI